jgi:predicted Zn-dependent protease
VLRLSRADACIAIGRSITTDNIRWANNTITTSGDAHEEQLSVVSVVGRRVAAVTRTFFPPDALEAIVRESETAARRRPEAPDYAPLVNGDGTLREWDAPAADLDIHVFDPFVPKLNALFGEARRSQIATFGYAELQTATTFVMASTGLRQRHTDRIGKVEITAKSPDFQRSSWAGQATQDFNDIALGEMFDALRQQLGWAARRTAMPAGLYEVLLAPSCVADLGIATYWFMTRRDADEGRSPFSKPGGTTRIGERLFGNVTFYSDPMESRIETAPFHYGVESGGAISVFDNGLALSRTRWARDGVLENLITPRYWAERMQLRGSTPYINNLVVDGQGPSLTGMIRETERALLVTCFWYIRTVDPQTALVTGLTRDGVFLVEGGEVRSAVNNFRWNMSPIAAFAQTTQIGQTGLALPREHDEFLRSKAPPLRIARFNMSSVSEAN